MSETETFVPPKVPQDEEGYCQSFSCDDEAGISEFFWKFGFAVVHDVIPQKNTEDTLQDVFRLARVDPNKPELWLNGDWKNVFQSSYNAKKGFLGYNVALSQASWNNRQYPNVYKSFCAIFKQKNLWVKLDRYGFMRPTRGLISGNTTVDKVVWETDRNWVHWDQNPWLEPEFCRVQALLTLTNHTLTSGGFHCIPGFTHYFKTWASNNMDLKEYDCLVNFPDSEIKKHTTKITMRRGSLLMWDSRTPHGNYPNESDYFRIVQYTGMFPVPQQKELQEMRSELSSGFVVDYDVTLSDLGKKIAGISDYEEFENGESIIADSIYNRDQCGY